VNFAVFIDTSRACRAVAPHVDSVSAASYRGPDIAAGSIASIFGRGLATSTASATTAVLPVELAGTRVTITAQNGVTINAPLFYVSPDQLNVLVPPTLTAGGARVTVLRSDGVMAGGTAQITITAPALFSANANGTGVAAATAIRVSPNGSRENVSVFQCAGFCAPLPIHLGAQSDRVYLSLYATGVRNNAAATTVTIGGVAAEVSYAGPQSQYAGLDQINVLLPTVLRGRGDVEVTIEQGGSRSNVVVVTIQ
jgi:uncharacterized protein (TIGR03437 family)